VALHVLDAAKGNRLFRERTFDDWHNSTLLDSRGALETVGIDTCILLLTLILPTICTLNRTSQKLRLQVHRIERIDSLVIVGLDLTCQTKFHQLQSFQLCRITSGGVLFGEIFSVLTFWDLLETLINGSHDCGLIDVNI
jgi:hypothetical protein